ncbi:hypothetical protein GYMLUDRAFT_768446 [Collybiopsis luxurians FD-317 M1]|uniref:Uncharacterized protein n=1 Tax=Collybiopsis luxurians FD-317 M1 TaxID=944289 RepID=A0A0D0BQA9_9AGAR|nr:hypothetical protein GYMLUDRAFT_768446 [Collybiopsis luxurians FD-317 M1]
MISRQYHYISLLAFQQLISLLLHKARHYIGEYQALGDLIVDSFLILWLPLSVWISLRQLCRCIGAPISSSSMTSLPPSEQASESISQHTAAETLNDFLVLVAFGHTWLAFYQLFYVIIDNYIVTSASNANPSVILITSMTLFLIIGFGKCLLIFGIPQDFQYWGYFLQLHKIALFIFSVEVVV